MQANLLEKKWFLRWELVGRWSMTPHSLSEGGRTEKPLRPSRLRDKALYFWPSVTGEPNVQHSCGSGLLRRRERTSVDTLPAYRTAWRDRGSAYGSVSGDERFDRFHVFSTF